MTVHSITKYLAVAATLFIWSQADAQSYRSLIPRGYNLRDSVIADLDGDKIKDMVLVLQYHKEEPFRPYPRPVLILRGTGHGYTIADRCDSLAMTTDMGGAKTADPYDNITAAANGQFTIEHHGGMGSFGWEHSVTFYYNKLKRNWLLYKVTTSTYSFNVASDSLEVSASSDTTKTRRDFGDVPFSKFSYNRFPVE